MSSIINKSSVRFTPKLKQRRSLPNTPTESRRASVTPSVEPKDNEKENKNSSDDENDDDDDDDDDDDFEVVTNAPNLPISRRSSTVDPLKPLETKQRRLSTLSNTSRAGDIFKKIPFVENNPERPHVISIPSVIPTAVTIRRRSSAVRKPATRKQSVKETAKITIDLPTPASTQEASTSQVQEEPESQSQPQTQSESVKDLEPVSQTETQKIQATTETETETETETQQDLSRADDKQSVEDEAPKTTEQALPTPNSTQDQPQSESQDIPDGKSVGFDIDSKTKKFKTVFYDDSQAKKPEIEKDSIFKSFDKIPKHLHTVDSKVTENLTIDQDFFTMKDLCKPTIPIGKASSNFDQARLARQAKLKQRIERRKIRINAKEEKRSLESFEELEEKGLKKIKTEALLADKLEAGPINAANAIQLKVGTDGNLIVDEDSRVLDRHANVDMSGLERQDENPFENIVNSATYGKQRYTDKWDDTEVRRLYEGLSQWGTDFGMIAQMYPHRTRRQIKAKFISEEKKRPRAIELALARKLNFKFDLDAYSDHANKKYAEVDEFNEKMVKLQKDHEENLKELSIAKEKAKEEDLEKQKKREFEVKTGQRTLTRQERLTELRKHETVLGSIDEVKKQREGASVS